MKNFILITFALIINFSSIAYANYKDIPAVIMNDPEVTSLITKLASKGYSFAGLLANGFVTGAKNEECSFCYDYSLYFSKEDKEPKQCYLNIFVVDKTYSPTTKPFVQDIGTKLKCFNATYSKMPEPTTTIITSVLGQNK